MLTISATMTIPMVSQCCQIIFSPRFFSSGSGALPNSPSVLKPAGQKERLRTKLSFWMVSLQLLRITRWHKTCVKFLCQFILS